MMSDIKNIKSRCARVMRIDTIRSKRLRSMKTNEINEILIAFDIIQYEKKKKGRKELQEDRKFVA